jgi:ABC-type multidrug transport system fused ATPase/permease subunit
MFTYKNFSSSIGKLWGHFSARVKFEFYLVLILIIITSVFEVMSIGMVIPFLSSLTSPESTANTFFFESLLKFFGVEEKLSVLFYALFFGVVSLVAGIMRLVLLYTTSMLTCDVGAEVSGKIFRLTLHQPYTTHLNRNSSEVISGILIKTNNATSAIGSLLTFISSATILISIIGTLILVQTNIALLVILIFGFSYGLVIFISKKHLKISSNIYSRESTNVVKILSESLGGIRDILIDDSQEIYCKSYNKSDRLTRHAQAVALFISSSPRYIIESLGMLLLAWLAYSLSKDVNGLASSIPALGFLALGAQKLLPVMQQIYSSWAGIRGGEQSLIDVINLLNQPISERMNQEIVQKMKFNSSLELRNICFNYSRALPYVIEDLNLIIKKGERIGIIGSTGSGKSTLIDIVMGLLSPSSGQLYVDEKRINLKNVRSWQRLIAHVPQAIFLADASITENIAFGVPKDEINIEKVKRSAEKAQLADFIERSPGGYSALVGERGIRLSGGQRQRIGIARALYKESDILIFDEATSALDDVTEGAVMKVLDGLNENLTLLIVAHRLTTLRNCQKILEMNKNRITIFNSYDEMIRSRTIT